MVVRQLEDALAPETRDVVCSLVAVVVGQEVERERIEFSLCSVISRCGSERSRDSGLLSARSIPST